MLRQLDAGRTIAQSGKVLPATMHSICMYSATPGAVGNARQLRAALETAGWRLVGPPEVLVG